ncbi:MAG TPA: hypothetical protein VF998_00195 [Candidatus Limnocylindria bacterium]
MLRILAVGTMLVALLISIKSQRLLQRAHLVGFCSTVAQAEDGSEWRSCVPGRLSGRPGLELNSCTDFGRHGPAEIWNCPAALDDKAQRE